MPEQFQHLTDETLPIHLKDGLYCLMHHVYRDRGQEVPMLAPQVSAERLLGEHDRTLQRLENGER